MAASSPLSTPASLHLGSIRRSTSPLHGLNERLRDVFCGSAGVRWLLDMTAVFRSEYVEATYGERMLFKEVALIAVYIFAGWSDATPGALLPLIQEHYSIGYGIVSMIFVGNLIGWISAAVVGPICVDRFGFGATLTAATAIAMVPSAVITAQPPFVVLPIIYSLSGLSLGLTDTLANSWMSDRPRAELRLGALHSIYGLGAVFAPLAAQPFLSRHLRFSWFFSISLGLATTATVFVTFAFRLKRDPKVEGTEKPLLDTNPQRTSEELVRASIELQPLGDNSSDIRHLSRTDLASKQASVKETPPDLTNTRAKFAAMARQSNVWILAVFCLLYVGTEVSIGGWSSTYIISTRGDRGSSNYIVAGFWGGIAIGRILLIPVTAWIGDQLAVHVYLGLSVGLQIVVWLAPDLIANAIALALQGFFLGPIFPILVKVATSGKIRPRAIYVAALSLIVSFGSAGSALFPFIIGISAQQRGIRVLAPILVGLLVAQILSWSLLGKPRSRRALEAEARED